MSRSHIAHLVLILDSRLINFFRTPEQLHTQANISAPLPLKPVEEKPYVRTLKRVEYPNTTVSPTSEFPNKIHREEETPKKDDPFTAFIKQEKTKTKEPGEKKVSMGEVKPMEVDEVVPEMKQNTVEEEEFVFVRFVPKIENLCLTHLLPVGQKKCTGLLARNRPCSAKPGSSRRLFPAHHQRCQKVAERY